MRKDNTSEGKYFRQSGFLAPESVRGQQVIIVGAGGIGAPTALEIAKLGDFKITVYDQDYVSVHNQPSSLYGEKDVDQFKVEALYDIVGRLANNCIEVKTEQVGYGKDQVRVVTGDVLIAATDSMKSRLELWRMFCVGSFKLFIDARMGGELAQVYTINKISYSNGWAVKLGDEEFYKGHWFPDKESDRRPCSERSIVYNTFMNASLITRAVKGFYSDDPVPREIEFDMKFMILQVTK